VDAGKQTNQTALFHAPAGASVLIDRACGLLGVSKRTIYYWIREGRLQTIRTRGGSQRILLASIERLPRKAGRHVGSAKAPSTNPSSSFSANHSVAVCP